MGFPDGESWSSRPWLNLVAKSEAVRSSPISRAMSYAVWPLVFFFWGFALHLRRKWRKLLKVTQEYDPQSWLFLATETNVGTWSYLPKHVPKRPAFRMTLPFKGLCDFKCSIAYPCDWFQLHQSPITMLNKGNAHCATVAFTDRDNSSEGRACLTPLSVRRDVTAILGRSLWTYPSKVVMLSFPSRPSRVASWRAVFLNLFVGGKNSG